MFVASDAGHKHEENQCLQSHSGYFLFYTQVKVKVKFTLEQATKAQRYRSTISLTSGQVGLGGQRHAPATLPPGKTLYPLQRWLQGRYGRMRKISPIRIRSPDRQARSKSLYQLSYPSLLCSTHSDNKKPFPQKKFTYVFSFYSHGKQRVFGNSTLTDESTHLTFWSRNFTFKFQHTLQVKCE